MYIPPGFNTITPYMFVDGAERLVTFLVDGFGGFEKLRTHRPDDSMANVQVSMERSIRLGSLLI